MILKEGPLNAFGILSSAPVSGRTSNSIKSPGTTAPSEKAATAPQLNEQDTLVQRAEHIPAGKRTPMCAHCNQVIRCVSDCWGHSLRCAELAVWTGPESGDEWNGIQLVTGHQGCSPHSVLEHILLNIFVNGPDWDQGCT